MKVKTTKEKLMLEKRNILLLYLEECMRSYKQREIAIFSEDDTYLCPTIKCASTKFRNAINEHSSLVPKENAYSLEAHEKLKSMLLDEYFKEACIVDDDKTALETTPLETVKESLGEEGYSLARDYFGAKAAIIALRDEKRMFKRFVVDLEPALRKFEPLRIFWEKSIFI